MWYAVAALAVLFGFIILSIFFPERCYCNQDQGAGYTYKDEHGLCEVCAKRWREEGLDQMFGGL